MHRISELICGIAGAENGHAELYTRGTSTRATYYTDFEGNQAVSSGANITLDGNGGAVVFVNSLVKVVVKDSGGVTVREFVAGDAASGVELRSLSATGTHYTSGASAPGNPTTMQAWADAWFTSAGAADFKADIGDGNGAQTLITLLGLLSGLFLNVKAFGATGDGVTDDAAAIQLAFDEAQGMGSTVGLGTTVYFPPGTYRITSEIVPTIMSMVGAGAHCTTIIVDSATSDLMDWGLSGAIEEQPRVVSGLSFGQAQPSSGALVRFTGSASQAFITFSNCCFETDASSTGPILLEGATGQERQLHFTNCWFGPGNLSSSQVLDGGTANASWKFVSCFFHAPVTYSVGAAGMFDASRMFFSNCTFWNAFCTAGGAWNQIRVGTGNTPNVIITGCWATGPGGGGATITFLSIADALEAGDVVVETGNKISTNTLYSMTFAGTENNIVLGSRINNRTSYTSDAAALTIDTLNYGVINLIRTLDTTIVVTLTTIPIGHFATVNVSFTGSASTIAATSFSGDGFLTAGDNTFTPPSAADTGASFLWQVCIHGTTRVYLCWSSIDTYVI
jgi:hypothetical protein